VGTRSAICGDQAPGLDTEAGRALCFGLALARGPEQPVRFTFGHHDLARLPPGRAEAAEKLAAERVGEDQALDGAAGGRQRLRGPLCGRGNERGARRPGPCGPRAGRESGDRYRPTVRDATRPSGAGGCRQGSLGRDPTTRSAGGTRWRRYRSGGRTRRRPRRRHLRRGTRPTARRPLVAEGGRVMGLGFGSSRRNGPGAK
jgi:hypothetical protein